MPAYITILLKNNFILERRLWRWTMFEIIIIIVFYTVIVVNPGVKSKDYLLQLEEAKRTQFYGNRTSLYDLSAFLCLQGLQVNRHRYGLIYAPETPFTTRIVHATQKALKLHHSLGVENERILFSNFNENSFLAGVIFHNISSIDNITAPEKLSVTLCFPSEFRTSKHPVVMHRLWLTRCTGELDKFDSDRMMHVDLYLREGFLQLQHRLFLEWIKVLQGTAPESNNDDVEAKEATDPILDGLIPAISIHSFRHHTTHEPCLVDSSSNIIWFLYYFTFFVPFLRLIKKFTREREENIPAHHWIYGYEQGHHWLAHFVVSFLHLLVLVLMITFFVLIEWTAIEKYHIFRHVNPGLFLLFLTLYITLMIIYAMIVSSTFSNATDSVLFGVTIWLGSYGLFSIVLDSADMFTAPVIICMSLFSNNFYPFGMKLMKFVESEPDNGLIWRLIYTEAANIILLLFILSLMDFLRPGRYIRRLYFNFLCIPCCCLYHTNSPSCEKGPRPTTVTLDRPSPSWQNFEYGPVVGQEALYLKNVITYLDRNRVRQQLKKITMRFFKNEISVILGAHSTGKTRLITMMAGWQKPHIGYIYYDGEYDVYENWLHYRNTVDVSMPDNPLYDLLTVRESIKYICEIKQDQKDLAILVSEVNKWIDVLKPAILNADAVLVNKLSFSQKRLLALCCAMAGNRKIILLDEPTNRMTYGEQKYYWEILRREKQNRAIILTTFSIDEADAIGDRIAIMNEGCLMAWGTPFFLKTQFGFGYDLIILKDPLSPSSSITELINKFVPNITPDAESGVQLIYKLKKDQRHLFQRMLIHLEKHSRELGISQIRMRGSDLGEVYMTLGSQDSTEPSQAQEVVAEIVKLVQVPATKLRRCQMNAMLYKKMIYQAPNVVPIVMIFAVFLLILLINELTKRIHVPSSINSGIQLGMPMGASSREFLDGFQNCSYVEINETETATNQIKLNNKSKYFLFKQFACGQNSYKYDVLRGTTIYDKLGSVELLDNGKHMILWIHERIFHTAALSLNLAHNLILRNLYPNNPKRLTTIVNKPMIIPLHVKINLIDNQISHLRLPLTFGIIMPITMSSFIVSLVEERYSHLMTLQRLAGMSMDIFWLVGVLWDFGTFFAFSLIYFLVMLVATIEGFGIVAKLLTLVLINVHGISTLCGIYLLSLFMPDSKYRAFLISIVVQFALGLCAYIFYWDVVETNKMYFYIFSLSPTFSLLDGIGNLYTETKEQEYCGERCEIVTGCNTTNMCALIPNCCNDKFFKWSSPGILPSLTFMTLSGILSSVAFFCVNLYRREKLHAATPRVKQMGTVCYPSDDKDVIKEKLRISDLRLGDCKKYSIVVDQIENHIPRRGKRLNTISFALEKYKCLGFYGGHSSGKSHLLQQLVGDRSFRFGEMFVCGIDAKYDQDEAYQFIGYCPQERGLCHAFTPRQLFTLLFMIRGIPKPVASARLKEISKSFNLHKYMSKRIAYLPAHIRRKLNIGLALMGHNKVLILDEPTRGMPAAERRQIWNILRCECFSGSTIVFSSSDSLECEALADNIAVIDSGEMLALGCPQYVRAKYTKGLFLEVKIKLDGSTKEEAEDNLEKDVENMLTYVKFLHEDAKLCNRYESTLKYYLPIENIRYSYLFGSLEKNRRRLNINEYTVDFGTQLEALDNILANRLLREPYKKARKSKMEVKYRSLGGSDEQATECDIPMAGNMSLLLSYREAVNRGSSLAEDETPMKHLDEGKCSTSHNSKTTRDANNSDDGINESTAEHKPNKNSEAD